MGAKLSASCLEARGYERERLKFMAVDQLNRCSKPVLKDEIKKAKVCKLSLEAAEIAITKTAFRTAVEYLESGLTILDHLTRWTARHYENTLRTFLILARMRLCCGRLESAKAAYEGILTMLNKLIRKTTKLLLLLCTTQVLPVPKRRRRRSTG